MRQIEQMITDLICKNHNHQRHPRSIVSLNNF